MFIMLTLNLLLGHEHIRLIAVALINSISILYRGITQCFKILNWKKKTWAFLLRKSCNWNKKKRLLSWLPVYMYFDIFGPRNFKLMLQFIDLYINVTQKFIKEVNVTIYWPIFKCNSKIY